MESRRDAGTQAVQEEGHANLMSTPVMVVEDGTGLPNSNSYVDLEDANDFLSNMQAIPDVATYWDILSSDQKTANILAATTYLETKFRFYGNVLTDTQAMQWPRTKNFDERGKVIPAGTIPAVLSKMNALLALYWSKDKNLFNEVSELGAPKSVTTDGFSVTMNSDAKEASVDLLLGKRFPEVELALKNLGEFKEIDWFENKRTIVSTRELK